MAKEFIKSTGTDDQDAYDMFKFISEKILGKRLSDVKKEMDIPVTSVVIVTEDVIALCRRFKLNVEVKVTYEADKLSRAVENALDETGPVIESVVENKELTKGQENTANLSDSTKTSEVKKKVAELPNF